MLELLLLILMLFALMIESFGDSETINQFSPCSAYFCLSCVPETNANQTPFIDTLANSSIFLVFSYK